LEHNTSGFLCCIDILTKLHLDWRNEKRLLGHGMDGAATVIVALNGLAKE
jgi:hypothetical protein